ncbi:hypothetical protein MP228_008749 [Amoeboaphelidium protococcarum]|nr:hypothetical protein MP228_008749 [Amoeboaphelidium protococcarum]
MTNKVNLHADHISTEKCTTAQSDAPFSDRFKDRVQLTYKFCSPEAFQFDLVGVDASFANAIRRIMIGEVPTMCIEKCFFTDNTGVMADELLAHRIGLTPIKHNPHLFQFIRDPYRESDLEINPDEPNTDRNTLVFKLRYIAAPPHLGNTTAGGPASSVANVRSKKQLRFYQSENVTAVQMRWIPYADQVSYFQQAQQELEEKRGVGLFADYWKKKAEEFVAYVEQANNKPEHKAISDSLAEYDELPPHIKYAVRPVFPDVVLDKLGANQSISIDLYAMKGIGLDHAKFSPVSIASYRLLPTVEIVQDVYDEDAHQLQKCFPRGVIEIERVKVDGVERDRAYVANARDDTVTREVFRHANLADKVKLGRKTDYFIFNVESTGVYDEPYDIVIDAAKILHQKCVDIKKMVDALRNFESNPAKVPQQQQS